MNIKNKEKSHSFCDEQAQNIKEMSAILISVL